MSDARILLCLLLLCAMQQPFQAAAQPSYSAKDSIEIYSLLDQADILDYNGRLDSAINTTKKALQLSRMKGMLRGEGFANLKIADLQLKKGNTAELNQHYAVGERIGLVLKDNFLLGLAYNQMAQFAMSQNNYDSAIEALEKALECYQADNLNSYVAYVFNELGFISDRKGDYKSAVEYYLQSVRLREQLQEDVELANTLTNLGIVYYRLGNKEEAKHIFIDCLKRQMLLGDVKRVATTAANLVVIYQPLNLDSALYYQNISVDFAEQSGVKSIVANSYQGKALLLKKQGLFRESLDFDKKAIDLLTELGNKEKIIARYSNSADTHDLLGDSVLAENMYQSAMALALQLRNKPMLQDLFLAKSNFYKKRKNYSAAFESLQKHYTYKDSIFSENTELAISDLRLKYETEKKDYEIKKLSNEQRIKTLEIEKQKAIIAGNKLEAQKKQDEINLLQQRQKLNEAIFLQQKEAYEKQVLSAKSKEQELQLTQQNLLLTKQEKELQNRQIQRQKTAKLLFALLGILGITLSWLVFNRAKLKKRLEHERQVYAIRNNIAKDLHDEIGSTLSSIKIMSVLSSQTIGHAPEQTQNMLYEISTQSHYIQQKMSDIVWAIRPDSEKIGALTVRMREFIAKTLEPKDISVSFEVNENLLTDSLSLEARKEVLLIFKEAINNVIKHAEATQVNISLVKMDGFYCLNISDNGTWKGPDDGSTGTGLRSMKDRAASIGGSLHILTGGLSTTLSLRLPVT